ncbi:MAG: hypothetical protein ABIQ95_09745 [Bdellovibrionia bacterium]
MRLKIAKAAQCGNVIIPANDYWVSLNAEAGEILLSAGGKDIRLKALRRRSTAKTKTTSVQFFSGGGRTWSLVFLAPKFGEWVAFIDFTE